MLPPEAMDRVDPTPDEVKLYSATRHRLDVVGFVHLTIPVAGQTSRQPFIVVRELGKDAVLETDFIDSQVESIHVRKRVLPPLRRRRRPNPLETGTGYH